jgi:hypothetical protein
LVIVALVVLGALGLTGALLRCGGPETPARATPPASATSRESSSPTPTASGATQPTTAAPGTTTAEPSTPTATPGPSLTPTLRPEVELARELIEPGGVITYSADACNEIFETASGCHVIKSAAPITRPEWEKLFPKTDFYLVKYDEYLNTYPPRSSEYRRYLIIEQDNQRYSPDSFDCLLKVNDIITITDENHEPVAKAFALMTIPDYIGEEVVFTEWRELEESGYLFHYLEAWTELQGLELRWWFRFENRHLKVAVGPETLEESVGDYIYVNPDELPPPVPRDYVFKGE